MKPYISKLVPFFVLLGAGFPLAILRRGWLFEILNTIHRPGLNEFFAAVTYLGDATYAILIALLIYWYKPLKWVYAFVIGFALHAVFVHVFKQWLAHGFERPFLYYQQIGLSHAFDWIEGLSMKKLNSFPSGHTTTVFFFASFLSSMLDSKRLPYLLAIVALTAGISRVYLGQHWYIDVYAGMLFGVWSTLIALYVILRYPKSWFEKCRN